MDGIYLGSRRPASKKAVKEAVLADPANVVIESTAMHGPHAGTNRTVDQLTIGEKVTCVGPDPSRDRRFYVTIARTANGLKVT